MDKLVIFALVLGCAFAVPLEQYEGKDSRIVGGSNAGDGVYPYQISLRSLSNTHFCGGSIISPNWIVTAAHCVYGQSASSMMVVVGTNRLSSGGTAYGVARVIWHESYNPNNNANDIAVLQINGYISYGPKVQPIRLANNDPPAGSSSRLSGWGLTSYPSQNLPDALQHIILTIISVFQCQSAMPGFPVYSTHVCTYQGVNLGACQGDSGGPLVTGSQSSPEQVGVVSWGQPCAKGYPDVFTSVASYRSWIRYYTGV